MCLLDHGFVYMSRMSLWIWVHWCAVYLGIHVLLVMTYLCIIVKLNKSWPQSNPINTLFLECDKKLATFVHKLLPPNLYSNRSFTINEQYIRGIDSQYVNPIKGEEVSNKWRSALHVFVLTALFYIHSPKMKTLDTAQTSSTILVQTKALMQFVR